MSRLSARLLYWSPRILTILFALFLSAFALEAFNEFHVFWKCVLAFCIGLLPAAIVAAILVVAWRWEWLGAALFTLAALYYAWSWTVPPRHMNWPATAGISGPLPLIAGLFLANWIGRGKLRTAH
ncbi:MAG: hypothetical protein ACLP07_10810 [Terracidiphilus sp.]